MAGIVDLKQKINQAASSGKASWAGTGQIKEMLTDLAELMQARGIIVVDDATALALITGADASLVFVRGIGLYEFDANSTLPHPSGSVIAGGGGLWKLLIGVPGTTEYSEIIGDGTTEDFVIVHNLNTMTPTLGVFDLLSNTPGYAPVTPRAWEVTDANTILVSPYALSNAPSVDEVLIVVKK